LVTAAAIACRALDAEHGLSAALKVVTATLMVGVVPGAMATLAWRPRPVLSAMQVAGFGLALSFGAAQILIILAVTLHLSATLSLAMLLTAVVLMAGHVLQRASGTVTISPDDGIAFCLLIVLGSCLYLVGAPLDATEDQIHSAIVRRLGEVASPRLDNLYLTPGMVYTYPFPGTHYFMTLVARLGDIDPLFVYYKLRFFWGTTAIALLYLIAWAVFRTRGIAGAVLVTAVALVLSGVFSIGFPSGWGQLAAYSHASDIAMTVLLPALLTMAFWFIQAESARERTFFLVGTALLVVMLTMVHIREIVQFTAYLGCFAVVAITVRRFRLYGRRALVLLALTVVTVGAYTSWQRTVAPLVQQIVSGQRVEFSSFAAGLSWRELLFTPASTLLVNSIQKFDQIFTGLTPFFLFAGPLVVVLFRRHPLVWLVAASTLAYLAVMTLPFLAVAYIYLTYFEILHIPVRNIHFFVYLLAGAFLYAIVAALTRVDRTRLSLLAVGAVVGVLGLLTALYLNRSHQGFFLPLIAAYGTTFLFLRGGSLPFRVVAPAVALLAGTFGLVSLLPDHQAVPRSEQVTVRWISGLPDARRVALEQRFSLLDAEPKPDRTDELNAWNYRLSDLSVDNVRGIVKHQDVVDTHFIDRSTFEVESQPPRGDDLPLGVRYVSWLQYPGHLLLVGTGVIAWGLGFVVPLLVAWRRDQPERWLQAAMSEPFYRRAIPFACFIVPFALWSMRPMWSPLVTTLNHPERRAATPNTLIAQLPCVTTAQMQARFTQQLFPHDQVVLPERTTCPPHSDLIDWVRAHVPVDAVFAIDRWDPYAPSPFMPQQVVVFPTFDASYIGEARLFENYYRLFYDRVGRYRVQPFFNAVETPAERAEFVEKLGVTHILVNPPNYDEMRPVLDALPGQFALKYAHEKWAVYEATRTAAAGGLH
jgi:hypothetical protein